MYTDSKHNRGSMLVLVLFLAGLLAVFAAVAATAMQASVNVSRNFADSIRAEESFRAAIELTMAQSGQQIAALRGTNTIALDRVQVAITVTNEASRIDLNVAPAELIAGLFRQVGVADNQADAYAARVLDWRDEDDQTEKKGGAERGAYRSLGRVDGPRNGPFVHPSELALVLGIPAAVAAAVAPYVTVASGQEQINPLLADPPVLLALPGTTANSVRDFLRRRADPTAAFESLIPSLGRVEQFVTSENGVAVRFEGDVRVGTNYQRRFEAVVYVSEGDNEPFRILSWDANPSARVRTLQ